MELNGFQSHLEDAKLELNPTFVEASSEAEPHSYEPFAAEGVTSSDEAIIEENPAYQSTNDYEPYEVNDCQPQETYEPVDWIQ